MIPTNEILLIKIIIIIYNMYKQQYIIKKIKKKSYLIMNMSQKICKRP